MDRLKRFALKKTAEGLDKILEAKAHFDRREEKKSNTKKILELKHDLSNAMFYGEDKDRVEAYEKIQILNRMLSEHELSSKDKKILEDMIKWHKSK
jgi:hypothetical protein